VQSTFEEYAQSSLVFSCIWSVGAILEEPVRPQFHEYILNLIKGQNVCEIYGLSCQMEPMKHKIIFNDFMIQNMFNVCYRKNEKTWSSWMFTVQAQ